MHTRRGRIPLFCHVGRVGLCECVCVCVYVTVCRTTTVEDRGRGAGMIRSGGGVVCKRMWVWNGVRERAL